MPLEIERRFIVVGQDWKRSLGPPQYLRQGYLNNNENGFTVRVRIQSKDKAWLTLKAPFKGIARYEFEYLIPINDAETLWNLSTYRLKKTRYDITIGNNKWVVDCFEGKNSPLVLAEVEIPSLNTAIEVPVWCSVEVTGQSQWSNASLAMNPISEWPKKMRDFLASD